MRFVADPAGVVLGAPAWIFLIIVLVWLPVAAVRQRSRLGTSIEIPSKRRIYLMAFVTQGMLLLLSGLVYRATPFPIIPAYRLTPGSVGIGLAALVFGLLPMFKPSQLSDAETRKRARLIVPRTPGQHATFYMVAISAGFAEEIAYRGVAFTLVAALTGSWWLSAVICSISFGVLHVFQGWKAAGIAGAIGLVAHIVVGLTGTLFVAMVQHTLHDIIVATYLSIRAAREDAIAPAGGNALAVS